MALFIGAAGKDILTSRAAIGMIEEWRKLLTIRVASLAPGEESALLSELRARLSDELALEEQLAAQLTVLETALTTASFQDELATVCRRFTVLAGDHFRYRRSVIATQYICNGFRDRLLAKTLSLIEELLVPEYGPAPAPYTLLAAGTSGRLEQSLSGCSDYFLIHDGNNDCADYFSRFVVLLMALFKECGLLVLSRHAPLGEYFWQGSVSDWESMVDRELRSGETKPRPPLPVLPTLTGPTWGPQPLREEYTLMIATLLDLRPVWGDERLAAATLEHSRMVLGREETMDGYRQLSRKIAAMPVAVGLFGWFRVARSGDHRGEFSLEQLALAPLIMTVRLCARQWGINTTSTVARIKGIFAAGRIGVELAERVLRAYHEFTSYKIEMEIRQSLDGGEFFFNPEELTADAAERFKDGLEAVVSLQKLFHQALVEAG